MMVSVALGRLVSVSRAPAAAEDDIVAAEMIESGTGRLLPDRAVDVDALGTRFGPGDVLFGKLRPYLAKVYRARGAGSAIGDLLVLSPNRHTDPDFLAYVLLSRVFLEQVNASTYGAKMPRASWDFIKTIRVIAPPLTKQRAIADFLDRETAKIDALIEKQSELVRLLRERKALSVSPRAGDRVGEGERSKRYFREVDSRVGAELAGLPLLSVSIDWGVLPRDESTSSQAASEDLARYKVVERGDIVVNRMRAFQGALGVAPSRGLASPDYAVLRVASYVSPQWLASLMRSAPFVSEMVARLRGIGTIDGSNVRTPRVAVADIGEIRIVVPPLWLQHEEMAESASSAAKIDALIAKAEKFIALAKERRAALITAAVTGQIDVIREAS